MFQQSINLYPAGGKEGDLASQAPRHEVLPPQGAFRAGKNGFTQARFAWRDPDNEGLINNTGTGKALGFVLNEGRGVIAPTDSASLFCVPGTSLGVWASVDAWARTLTAATIGQKIFAVLADGTIKTGAEGATIEGAVETNYWAASSAPANSLIKITRYGV